MANSKQLAAVTSLVSLLSSIRGLDAKPETIEQDGKLFVDLQLPGFPIISIGKQGGYGLPDVKSYPENGKPDAHAFPGNTALDAALFGDMHVTRQATGRVRKAATVTPANGTTEQGVTAELAASIGEEFQTGSDADADADAKELAAEQSE